MTEREPSSPPHQTSPGPPAPVPVEVTARTMLVALLVATSAWIALRLVPVLFVLVVALILIGTLNPAVEWLCSKGLGRGIAVAVVFIALVLGGLALLALTVPRLFAEVSALVEREPAIRERLMNALSSHRATRSLGESLKNVDYGALLQEGASSLFKYSTQTAEVIAYLVSALFLALYIMLDRDRLRGMVYAMVPRRRHVRFATILLKLEVIVGGYIRGQLLTSALMAAFTWLLLTICGVQSALAVGIISGLADVLPYIGVFISVGIAVAAAAGKGTVVIIAVLVALLAYEEFESRFLVPRIYGRVLKLPSSIVLVSLLTGGALLGIPGVLLSLPVAAAIRMFLVEVRVRLPGENVVDPAIVAEDTRLQAEYERRVAGVPAQKAAAVAVELARAREATLPTGARA